jgi:hypothetical protein
MSVYYLWIQSTSPNSSAQLHPVHFFECDIFEELFDSLASSTDDFVAIYP